MHHEQQIPNVHIEVCGRYVCVSRAELQKNFYQHHYLMLHNYCMYWIRDYGFDYDSNGNNNHR